MPTRCPIILGCPFLLLFTFANILRLSWDSGTNDMTLDTYGHLLPDDTQEVSKRLGETIFGSKMKMVAI